MLLKVSKPAFAAMAMGLAFSAAPAQAQTTMMTTNAIQPETTLSISATAKVMAEPDVAYLNGGVTSEAETAKEALRKNAADMAGVYEALEAAGLDRKHIQTSNFSLQPKYVYPKNGERYLSGYTVSNQVMAKVTDMDNVGPLIDAMVSQGGNTFNGVSFSIQDPSDLVDEARRKAMTDAMERAKLYADVAGYDISRIVTIDEGGGYSPEPRPQMMRAASADMAESTQISGGELTYSASVNVVFELKK